ncbi:MAG: methionyl-tRNA formyltransferase, partial [bacterium]|nr:methionyl-tRNA formyltransferase [bacterium]
GKSPIVGVVTQPPKSTGRAQLKTYSAMDKWAFEHKIPIFYSSKDLLDEKIEVDLGILAAFSEILPDAVIKLFPQGILNIHPSLLPKLRGASPIQGTIITEDSVAGVTIMKMDEKLDHGPIISQFKDEIKADDTTGTLRARLFERSAEVLGELLEPYLEGKIKLKKQDESAVTTTRKITKEDGRIPGLILESVLKGEVLENAWKIDFIKDYSLVPSAYSLDRFIRAMNPWPEAWTLLRLSATEGQAKRLKILKAHLGETTGILEIDEVQLEGKNPVSWKQFKSAYPEAKFS